MRPALLAIPLIVLIAHFPMVLDNDQHGIEVGFDSMILVFLLCTIDVENSIVIWSLGVILTQLTTHKRLMSKLFNIGVGILAGSYATGVLVLVRGDTLGTVRELVAVGLATACYFATDFVLSASTVAIAMDMPVRTQLLQPGTLLAVACFVPFDTLGYLAAVVYRVPPGWTLGLLAVPIVILLVATRALTRGRENARRLTVLFDAAVRAQTLSEPADLVESLLKDARALVRLSDVSLRVEPPGQGEIGAEVVQGRRTRWIVARATERARSTVSADEEALKALAAVASEGLARIALTTEMVHVARHDPLTDLPNRGILLDRLDRALDKCRTHKTRLALIILDLDGFKPINDRFGHGVGDAVLVELAARLVDCGRLNDTVARLGGDEFAILVEDVDSQGVEALCHRMLVAVETGVMVGDQLVPLGASIGTAYGDGKTSAAGLLRRADLAMYEAKQRGKGRFVEYESSFGRARLERLDLVADLRRAVTRKAVNIEYQPLVDAHTGRMYGAEALARWSSRRHSGASRPVHQGRRGNRSDRELGASILERVVADAAAIGGVVDNTFAVTVNISVSQLLDPGFVSSVERAASAMPGVQLVLEITERQGIEADPVVLAALHDIAALGVRIAIDDFGVGFSSLSYLNVLPVQIIKVDASLSRDIDRDERAASLLCSVILMGRSLGLEVVVEGVERQGQLDRVRAVGPPILVQGYLMHRSMPLMDLLDVLSRPVVERMPVPVAVG